MHTQTQLRDGFIREPLRHLLPSLLCCAWCFLPACEKSGSAPAPIAPAETSAPATPAAPAALPAPAPSAPQTQAPGPALKAPATVAEAASVLDLTTFPLLPGASAAPVRTVANVSYRVTSDPKSAFQFQRKELLARQWTQLPNGSATGGTFVRDGFKLSTMVMGTGPDPVTVMLLNHGNVDFSKLPAPTGAKQESLDPLGAIYSTKVPVAATSVAVGKLLQAVGWQRYGPEDPASTYYKQNAVLLSVVIEPAPTEPGKTFVTYSSEQMSADLPAMEDATQLKYVDAHGSLEFNTAANKDAIVAFYRKTLAPAGWTTTMKDTVKDEDKDVLAFDNPAHDKLTVSLSAPYQGKISAYIHQETAAFLAALRQQAKEDAAGRK